MLRAIYKVWSAGAYYHRPEILTEALCLMHVAIIVGRFPNISETFILRQITGLIDLGHEVSIFSENRPDKASPTYNEIAEYDLLSKTIYLNIPATIKQRVLGAPKAIGKTFAKRPKLALSLLNPFRYQRTALTLSALYRLNGLINHADKPYDVVHCHYGGIGKNYRFVKKLWGTPLLVSFHGFDCSEVIRSEGIRTYARLFREADGVTVTGNYMKKRLIELGASEDIIYVLHCGTNVHDYSFKMRSWEKKDTLKLLTVARLTEKKGLRYSLEAVAKVKRNNININYQIIGEGPLRPLLEKLIRDFEIGDIVQLRGALENNAVREAMAESHIFILPSVTASNGDQEGVPVSLMEASSSGMPILSTLHSGIPEVVLDGKSGFLVPERDVDALAERLIFLMQHPEIWGEMGWKGRQHIEENYNIPNQNHKLVGIYNEILEKANNRHYR